MLMYLNGSYKSLWLFASWLTYIKNRDLLFGQNFDYYFDYLNRVGSFYSSSYDIIEGIAQESILEPSHFNIF